MVLVVADAGPLIFLSVVGKLELLRGLFDRVVVPTAVFDEVVGRGTGMPGSLEVAAAAWIEVIAHDARDPVFQMLRSLLDAGEAAALALASRHGADLVVIDERRGREMARRMNLRVQGTLGLLLHGKRSGEISAIAPLLEALVDHGFWISEAVLARVLDAAGESEPAPPQG